MKPTDTRLKLINIALWIAFTLAMTASIQHLAWTFGTVELPGLSILGWIPAIAVDAGLAALAYAIQQRKKAKRGTRSLWWGIALFAFISALANLYHALAVESGGKATLSALLALDLLQIAKSLVLSATLPALVVYLGEIVSGDDVAVAKTSEAEADRERMKAEREARKADLQAERQLLEAKAAADKAAAALLEAERLSQPAEPQPTQSETPADLVCACGYNAKSQNAMNAHKRGCPLNENHKSVSIETVAG
jgi:hypothetical protein